jgi:transposase
VVSLAYETDIEVLRQVAQMQEREIQRLHERLRVVCTMAARQSGDDDLLQRELLKVEEQLARCQHELYGRSSEKRPHARAAGEPRPPHRGHGPKEQPRLPVVEQLYTLDDADKTCPSCGGELAPWKGQFEESKDVHMIERQVFVRKHKRQKYRCKCGNCIETALGPLKLRPDNHYSIEFAVAIAVAKYLDHIPLERQVRMLRRLGLEVESQTLWDQVEMLARLLHHVPDEIWAHLIAQKVVCADETPWRMLVKGDEGKKSWYVWAVCGTDAAFYRIQGTRSAEGARALLGDFAGVLMTDGYKAYDRYKREGGKFTQAHCWSHVRREFLEAARFYPREGHAVANLIDELFRIERLAGCGPPNDPGRVELTRKLRAERSEPVIRALEVWGMEIPRRFLPEATITKAAKYMAGLWPGLVRFLEDPEIPLTSNAVERSLRGVVVGRKNFYGTKSVRGADVAALFYTLFESAKLCGLEPAAYVRDAVVAKLNGEKVLLPHEVQGQRSNAAA